MMEALSSSETSVLARVMRRNIPEDGIPHSHHRGNLKSYKQIIGFSNSSTLRFRQHWFSSACSVFILFWVNIQNGRPVYNFVCLIFMFVDMRGEDKRQWTNRKHSWTWYGHNWNVFRVYDVWLLTNWTVLALLRKHVAMGRSGRQAA
jgi:hypothetical protein